MLEFSERIASEDFAQMARHPDFSNAFTRKRKLPLPALIAALLTMRNQSQQAMLDAFFGSVRRRHELSRVVSDRAFAKARDRLHLPALASLNDLLVARADAAGLIPRWCGLRVVAADASLLMPATRPSLLSRSGAERDQRLFVLYLPGAELTLHASVHSQLVAERRMLVEALDVLGPDDVLVLDRGYPAAWLVALLNARGIRFVMRCDNRGGWTATRKFVRSGAQDALVSISAPSADEVKDWQCPAGPPGVRMVRQTSPNGQVRVLVTNLPSVGFPAALFGDLYHQRWRIEEAFKRLKHPLKLESVSGLSQQALIIDVAAKVLTDNITSLMCMAASAKADHATHSRKCNRAYAATVMQRLLPGLVLALENAATAISDALSMLGATYHRFVPARSRPRPKNHIKPHPSMAYKG